MVCPEPGSVITLVCGVSRRILPSLERHMRDADCVGGPPAAGCVFVAQSEQEGGVGGGDCGIWTTAGLSLACPAMVTMELRRACAAQRYGNCAGPLENHKLPRPGTDRPGREGQGHVTACVRCQAGSTLRVMVEDATRRFLHKAERWREAGRDTAHIAHRHGLGLAGRAHRDAVEVDRRR